MSTLFKVAGVQMDVLLANRAHNVAQMKSLLQVTAAQGTQLTVFPECCVSGYCFESRQEALPVAESIPGPATEDISAECRRLNVFALFGMLERDGDKLFNACVLVGPQGVEATYRKIHLPRLGVDHFADPGDRPFAVHDLNGLRIGMNICYDGSFPESARCLALAGADLIVLPTNWPTAAANLAKYVVNIRAMENHIYYLSVNRIGQERDFAFIGYSRLSDPFGNTLDAADHDRAAIIYGEVDPAVARKKRLVRNPGNHVVDRLRDRRPGFYERINSDYVVNES